MPTGAIENSNLACAVVIRVLPSLEMGSPSVPSVLLVEHVEKAASSSMELPADAVVDGRAFKGACWALAIEGTAAICIFFVWRIFSLIH
jgi:hypothetical protein